jgi:probable addiction module antidote protein
MRRKDSPFAVRREVLRVQHGDHDGVVAFSTKANAVISCMRHRVRITLRAYPMDCTVIRARADDLAPAGPDQHFERSNRSNRAQYQIDGLAQLRCCSDEVYETALMDAWLCEAPDDAAGIARALGGISRAKGMTQVARDSGLNRETLYQAPSEDGHPSLATVLTAARALGLRLLAESGSPD